MPLNQVGTVSVPEPRMIVGQVWDKGLVKAVDKAIREAGLGLNPQTDGQIVRVPIPELNEERRKELTKRRGKICRGGPRRRCAMCAATAWKPEEEGEGQQDQPG